MKSEFLSQLIDKTFTKLSCPTPGIGLYNELKSVITLAFELGKEQEDMKTRYETTHMGSPSTENTPEMSYTGAMRHP